MPEMVRINSSEKLEVTMLARPAITFHDHLESNGTTVRFKNKDMILLFFNRHEPCPSKEATLYDAKALIELTVMLWCYAIHYDSFGPTEL